ncbi:MAG: hypothetical protein AB1610_04645 [Nitrospirota bacterium]
MKHMLQKGICQVELEDGTVLETEVHWYEGHGIGKKDMSFLLTCR